MQNHNYFCTSLTDISSYPPEKLYQFIFPLDGETVETVPVFIFLDSKITEDGDCSHEIKRHLLLGRKVMTNVDIILESRDITLPTRSI